MAMLKRNVKRYRPTATIAPDAATNDTNVATNTQGSDATRSEVASTNVK